MERAKRLHKSLTARKKRREKKKIVSERMENFFSKMRRLRKKR